MTAENWMGLRKQPGLTDENIIEKVKFTVQAEGASRDKLEKIVALTEDGVRGWNASHGRYR